MKMQVAKGTPRITDPKRVKEFLELIESIYSDIADDNTRAVLESMRTGCIEFSGYTEKQYNTVLTIKASLENEDSFGGDLIDEY